MSSAKIRMILGRPGCGRDIPAATAAPCRIKLRRFITLPIFAHLDFVHSDHNKTGHVLTIGVRSKRTARVSKRQLNLNAAFGCGHLPCGADWKSAADWQSASSTHLLCRLNQRYWTASGALWAQWVVYRQKKAARKSALLLRPVAANIA